MVVTVWAVLVAVLVCAHVLAEGLLALFADKDHLGRLAQWVVAGLGVALGTLVRRQRGEC